jgi:hypothetical protein
VKRTLVIACEVIARELRALAAVSPRVVDIVFLPKGLHDQETSKMRARLQEEIDGADGEKYEMVVMGYGLCNNGTIGLRAGRVPLAIPRVHDCISFFFGSRERYRQYFDEHPGTYYETTGWSERGTSDLADSVMSQLGLSSSYGEYVEKYGKENADYITSVLGGWRQNYRRLTYVRMPIPGLPDYTEDARAQAEANGWELDVVDGDVALIEAMARGPWDEERFCILEPGETLGGAEGDCIFSKTREGARE